MTATCIKSGLDPIRPCIRHRSPRRLENFGRPRPRPLRHSMILVLNAWTILGMINIFVHLENFRLSVGYSSTWAIAQQCICNKVSSIISAQLKHVAALPFEIVGIFFTHSAKRTGFLFRHHVHMDCTPTCKHAVRSVFLPVRRPRARDMRWCDWCIGCLSLKLICKVHGTWLHHTVTVTLCW